MQEIEAMDLDSWEEFEERLKELRRQRHFKYFDSLPLLFRGQENSDWPLNTTLDRSNPQWTPFAEYFRRISKIRPEIESFIDRKWLLPEYPEVRRLGSAYDQFSLRLSSGKLPAYAYMAYLRHHGFPSPLLDWSRSSHIAAFFAFRKAFVDNDQENKKVSIFVLSGEQFTSRGNGIPLIFRLGPYVRTHRRHFLQQSEYTLCLIFENEWRFAKYSDVFHRPHQHQGVFQKFNIPLTEGRRVLRLLDEYNLNASSLFGSEEGLMETLAMREFAFGAGGSSAQEKLGKDLGKISKRQKQR
jgi:hypothetical protein